MKNLLKLTAILLFISPISVFSENNYKNISDIAISQIFSSGDESAGLSGGKSFNFSYSASSVVATPVLPEPRVCAPVLVKGDFSAIPDYSFNHLEEVTVKLIDASRSSIDVVMYSLTLQDMPDALRRASDRGVKVRIIMDEGHVYPNINIHLKELIDAGGIDIRTLRGTRSYGVNHNKIGVFDMAVASVGSYNWTFSATFYNFENMLIVRDNVHVSGFVNYFEWMWARSRTLEQGASPEVPEGYYGTPPQAPAAVLALNGVPVPAYVFSPGSNTEERLSRVIGAAKNTLDVLTFTFSSKSLADAVVGAKNRGVKVRMLMDSTMAKTSAMAKYVFDSGVDFRVRGGRTDTGALHNKFAILDGGLLETGSFNWTTNASVNSFENVVFTDNKAALKEYQSQFDWFYSSSAVPGVDFFTPNEPFADRDPDEEGLEPF